MKLGGKQNCTGLGTKSHTSAEHERLMKLVGLVHAKGLNTPTVDVCSEDECQGVFFEVGEVKVSEPADRGGVGAQVMLSATHYFPDSDTSESSSTSRSTEEA